MVKRPGADLGGFTGFQKLLKISDKDLQQQNTQILINVHPTRIVSNKWTLLAMFKQLSLKRFRDQEAQRKICIATVYVQIFEVCKFRGFRG